MRYDSTRIYNALRDHFGLRYGSNMIFFFLLTVVCLDKTAYLEKNILRTWRIIILGKKKKCVSTGRKYRNWQEYRAYLQKLSYLEEISSFTEVSTPLLLFSSQRRAVLPPSVTTDIIINQQINKRKGRHNSRLALLN